MEPGETIDEQSALQLKESIANHLDHGTAYQLFVQRPSADVTLTGEQAAQLRVYPNNPQLRFTGRIAESLLPAIAKTGLKSSLSAIRSRKLPPCVRARST